MSIEKFKKDITSELEYYWNKKDQLNTDFEKSWNDKTKYSGEFIQTMRTEADTDINDYKLKFYDNIRKQRDKYIEELKPNTKAIGTLEYQTRLSNIIKLAEISDGFIPKDSLSFMVEANDTETLNVLSSKYKKSVALSEARRESDLEHIKEEFRTLCQVAENHIGYESLGATRSSILSSFR